MSIFLAQEFDRVKREYYDPSDSVSLFRYLKQCSSINHFDFGIVTDNQDPDKLGRVKVQFPHWGENIVSSWAMRVSFYSGNKEGWWSLPEVGEQVICAFIDNNPAFPVILGSVFTPRNPPPLEQTTNNDLKYFTTKGGSKLLINDKEGEEKITIHSKDGKMRLVVDNNKGISIVNETGDIKIKCRKIKIDGADSGIKIKNNLVIKAKSAKINSGSKEMVLKSGADIIMSGSPIALKGQCGVAGEMKQLAKKDDQVIGIDFHDIQVPSPSGLQPTPMIPHPYLGKLVDNLSEDVKIGDAPAAFKGSKSMFDTPGHICMPPGVSFVNPPNNEGEVSSGTIPSVLINGNEAAALGSMVKTCNDPQPQETCTIIAVGAAVCLPILIPGMDPEEFKRAGGTVINTATPIAEKGTLTEKQRNRKVTTVQWGNTEANTGDEITLKANLQNQNENATVYFKIFKEGDDPATTAPTRTVNGRHNGGHAEAKIRLYEPDMDADEESIKYFFIASSFNCGKVKSSNITINKIIPEFTELKWEYVELDEENEEVSRSEQDNFTEKDTVSFSANVENYEDGKNVKLRVLEETDNGDKIVIHEELLSIEQSYISSTWIVEENTKATLPDEPITPKYLFSLEFINLKIEPTESSTVDIFNNLEIEYRDEDDLLVPNMEYKIITKDDSVIREGSLDDEGKAVENELGRCNYIIHFPSIEDNSNE